MKKKELLRDIERNKSKIALILRRPECWMPYTQWVKTQLLKENERLFPKSPEYVYHSRDSRMRKDCLSDAFDYANKCAVNHDVIDEFHIRRIHTLIGVGADVRGGAIRTGHVDLGYLNIDAPDTNIIYYRMRNLCHFLEDGGTDPIDKALHAHYELVSIQPFDDLNKRTARTVMNWVLSANDYTPILFNRAGDREKYIGAIRNKQSGERYEDVLLHNMLRTQEQILSHLSRC